MFEKALHMNVNDANRIPPFCRIREAVKITGLSEFFLRKGCIEGTIPHLRSGRTYFINMEKLFEQLDRESDGGVKDG